MRVLVAHVAYQYRGGEEVVVETEARLLREAGHAVSTLVVPSSDFYGLPRLEQVRIGLNMGDHPYGRALIRAAVEEHRPDVVHFHNLYPLLGVGAMAEAASLGCAVVRTLHNFRLSCIAGTHFRNGQTCNLCTFARHTSGVLRGCYRESRIQSAAMARACVTEWRFASQEAIPHATICVSDFLLRHMTERGYPAARLHLKPNSVERGRPYPHRERRGACFVGRLSVEKGVLPLVESWPAEAPPLTIVGDGPLRGEVEQASAAKKNVVFAGPRSAEDVRQVIRSSRVAIVSSLWYETSHLVTIEAFSEGTPVASFSQGALQEHMRSQGFEDIALGDFAGLVSQAAALCEADEQTWSECSSRALEIHRAKYSHEKNLAALTEVYEAALATARERR
jgi:glycosyltransferase involved in cell wall biosynthesis